MRLADERFFDEFAEDFFAESTEHLETVRGCLLELEDADAAGRLLSPARTSAILRSLHTVKGLCGMVGLADGASIAHGMEEVLRAVDLERRTAPADTMQLLFDATAELGHCLKAYRNGTTPPDVTRVTDALAAYTSRMTPESDKIAATSSGSRRNYVFTFAPAAHLAARGVGVELVRTRLQSLGEVVRVTPRVGEGSSILFEFSVLLEPGREPLEEWRADAMDWRAEEQVSPPAVSSDDATQAVTSFSSARLVRVDLGRLDALMLLAGELVMTRARLEDDILRLRTDRTPSAFHAVEDSNNLLERQLRDLRAAIMRVRLVPIGEVFERMRFVARDVARETGRQVRIEMSGGNTEIDKVVVERMVEPMLHLVRNAVSHGIEPAAERVAAGKDAIGLITLRAHSAGDQIVIEVIDDGAGLDAERIRAVAKERGVAGAADADADLLEILCTPGFSTRSSTDLAAGRGVGMDVVRKTVAEVGGQLHLDTEKNSGTRFTIRLPLTLMIVDALLVSVAGQTYAIPQPSLREVLQITPDEIVSFENNEVLRYRENVLPLIRLRSVFALTSAGTLDRCNVLVVGSEAFQVGLVADRIIGLREIVVRSVGDPLVTVPGIAGAAELSDGSVALILDANGLVQYANKRKLRLA
jgi:two-component system, chemotaxis family, sensor kinase CheA